jgi:hypothetical protein
MGGELITFNIYIQGNATIRNIYRIMALSFYRKVFQIGYNKNIRR